MAMTHYTLDVDRLTLTATGYTIAAHLAQTQGVNVDYASGAGVTLTFGGYTLELTPASPSTQMGFKLSQPGHPMNGAVGIAWGMMMIDHSSDIFGQYELTLPISNTEKLAIRLGP